MSTAGVLLGLIITNEPFSAILTGVGNVSLAGIVVNNNIVLIDTFNNLRQANPDEDLMSIIVRTGVQRFRPVMLTTVTTVTGLLPLASHLSVDFINNTVIVGGQLSGFWVPLGASHRIRSHFRDFTDTGINTCNACRTNSSSQW